MPFNDTHQGATRYADPLTLAYIKRLEDALNSIKNHRYCNGMISSSEYDNEDFAAGLTNGHRYCAAIAREALRNE